MSDKISIVQARETSRKDINQLIARSKALSDWPEEYLSRALPLHEISSEYLGTHRCFEVLTAYGELVAFVSVTEDGERVVLDNLWVAPEHVRRGIGTAAMHFVFGLARECGWRELWVLPDPPSEGFYQTLGFVDSGERVPSRVPAGPVFSLYRIAIA
jgi:GNAT superfamily N-acetyltransferase